MVAYVLLPPSSVKGTLLAVLLSLGGHVSGDVTVGEEILGYFYAAHFPLGGGGSVVVALEPDGRLVGRVDQPVSAGSPAWQGLLELARLRR